MNVQKLLYQNVFWRGSFFATGFILNILVARKLGADTTGWLYYLFTLFSFFTLIGSFSMEAAIIYFGSKGEIALRTLANFAWKWTVMVALLILIVGGGAIFMNRGIKLETASYALVFICGNILITFMSALFYARKEYRTSNAAAIVVNLLLIAAVVIFREEIFVRLYFGSYLVLGLFLSLLVFLQTSPAAQGSNGHLKKLLRYSLLAFCSNFVFFLLYKIDYWFVNRYTSATDLGNYIQVSKIAQIFFIVPGIIAQALFPLFAGDYIREVQKRLQLLSRTIFFCYLLLCAIVGVSGKWLFPLIFGESFSGMYLPFILLIPGILALSTLYSLSAWFSGNNLIRVNLTGSAIATVIIIAGDALLIPQLGINAAALVSSVGYICYHLYVLHVFNRMHNTKVSSFFSFRPSDIASLKALFLKRRDAI